MTDQITTSNGTTVIEGKESIALFSMMSLNGRLKLELKGMKSRGRSAFSIVKQQYGLKGNRQAVYDAFHTLYEQAKADYAKSHQIAS